MKKLFGISSLAAIGSLVVDPALAQSAMGLLHGKGHGAPAPEIGAGMLGMLLATAAVKYFRNRSR